MIVQLREAVDRGVVVLPPAPEVATRILELLKDDSRSGAREVAELVRNDPAVTATVLKMANSAMFGGLKSISNVSHAVARLGLKNVASIVTALVHQNNYRGATGSRNSYLTGLWDHALAVASTARRLGATNGGDAEQAFLAGLLHDVGKLVVLKGVEHLELGDTCVTPELLDELMDSLHTSLGHRTLESWGLPDPICEVVLHHHDAEVDPQNHLLAWVQAANAIARRLGDPQIESNGERPLDEQAIDRLDLSDLELAELLVDVEDELAEIRRLL